MNERRCDRFEVAVEMRLHGDLGVETGAELDAHLGSCPSCHEFESRARTIDQALRNGAIEEEKSVDWSPLRARVSGWRSQSFLVVILVATIVLTDTMKNWLDRIARTSGPAPSLATIPFDVLLNAVLVGFVVWHVWNQWRDVRRATSPRYLNHLYRQDLAARIRSVHIMTWFSPGFLLLFAFGRPDFATRLIYALFFAGLAWERFVVLPRLEREEQDLPFFDDFPHLF